MYAYDPSTPPPPPPKPSAHSSGTATPQTGPPLPPPPPQAHDAPHQGSASSPQTYPQQQAHSQSELQPPIAPPEDGWLPELLQDKTTADLHHILQTPSLQTSLIHDPRTTHPSLPASTTPLQTLLSQNVTLAQNLKALEAHVLHQRQTTQSRLLSLRALERQWQTKQAEQDDALREFSPPAMYQRLSAAVGEQEALCRGLEESFLEGDVEGEHASEREVSEFVRRYREGRKVAFLRRERKERWDEGRVGGWR